MRMMRLAYTNFKSSLRSYLSLILSLAFTIMIFLNFQNVVYSKVFDGLGKQNRDYIAILIQTISFVMACFMFFFIWYSTNVFLQRRKKEIGIYAFMGLTNQKIGKLYMIETTMTGVAAFALGTVLGLVTTRLFQMILLALSEITVPLHFQISWKAILITGAVYLAIYMLFVLKGYISIVRSSVLNLILASRQNEYVRQNKWILMLKTILGLIVLLSGFYLATREGGMEVMGNVFAAVVLVIAGVYLLFGGLIPAIFQGLTGNKGFLYKKQRTLWINSIVFRMKKNYRTYAMVCVLMLCAVTALATGFAMKYRYQSIIQFRNSYTFQFLTEEKGLNERAEKLIEETNEICYKAYIPILQLPGPVVQTDVNYGRYAVIAYSQTKELARNTGMEFDFPEPADDEIISATHLTLLSIYTRRDDIRVVIDGKTYQQVAETTTPYMGYLQENMSFYIVNDREYEKLCSLGQEFYTYNYRISRPENFEKTREALDVLVNTGEGTHTGRVSIDPANRDIDWIKVLYSLGSFLFLVFILASGSIMFMRFYNDAFEERERYQILRKLGYSSALLQRSVACELGASYGVPFLVMAVSSYFSVHALEKMMFTNLLPVNLVSLLITFCIFLVCYGLSVTAYLENSGIQAFSKGGA